MNKPSKEETQRLINHALDSSDKLTAQELAKQLGVPPSRISEGLSGKWRLTGDQARQLILDYGQPRGAAGRFVRAETAESITDFLQHEPEISQKRHLERILNYMSSSENKERLAKCLTDPKEEYSTKEVLERMENFISSPPFREWLEGSRGYVNRSMEERQDPDSIVSSLNSTTYYDLSVIDKIPVPAQDSNLPHEKNLRSVATNYSIDIFYVSGIDLLLIGELNLFLKERERYSDIGTKDPTAPFQKIENLSPEENDYILTGDVVWEEEISFKTPKLGKPAHESLFYPLKKTKGRWSGDNTRPHRAFCPSFSRDRYEASHIKQWDLDYWTTCKVELFLDSNCNYNMILELGDNYDPHGNCFHIPKRTIVIPKIPGLDLFNQLNDLRSWLDLEELPETTIKEEIAKCGGYIPGTIVI